MKYIGKDDEKRDIIDQDVDTDTFDYHMYRLSGLISRMFRMYDIDRGGFHFPMKFTDAEWREYVINMATLMSTEMNNMIDCYARDHYLRDESPPEVNAIAFVVGRNGEMNGLTKGVTDGDKLITDIVEARNYSKEEWNELHKRYYTEMLAEDKAMKHD